MVTEGATYCMRNQPFEIQMTSNKKGFTLIELLIVVVIIGILAAIAIPKFANTKDKAYVAAMKSDLRNLATYEEQ
jgi:type IV pilus assembly protein PilA